MRIRNTKYFIFSIFILFSLCQSVSGTSIVWYGETDDSPLTYTYKKDIFMTQPSSIDIRKTSVQNIQNIVVSYDTAVSVEKSLSILFQSYNIEDMPVQIDMLYIFDGKMLNYSVSQALSSYTSFVIELPYTIPSHLSKDFMTGHIYDKTSYAPNGLITCNINGELLYYSFVFHRISEKTDECIETTQTEFSVEYYNTTESIHDEDTIHDAVFRINEEIFYNFQNQQIITCYSEEKHILSDLLSNTYETVCEGIPITIQKIQDLFIDIETIPIALPLTFRYQNISEQINQNIESMKSYTGNNQNDSQSIHDVYALYDYIQLYLEDQYFVLNINKNQSVSFAQTSDILTISYYIKWDMETGMLSEIKTMEYHSDYVVVHFIESQKALQKNNIIIMWLVWTFCGLAGIGSIVGIVIKKKQNENTIAINEQISGYRCSDPDLCCHNGVCEDT